MPKLAYDLDIYTYHIDFAGHVSNIVYIQWMEIGRLELLKAAGMPIDECAARGFHPVLVETAISYKQPFHLGETVRGQVWFSEIAKASAWLEFSFADCDGNIRANGRQRGLFVTSATGRPRRFLPEELALFEQYRA